MTRISPRSSLCGLVLLVVAVHLGYTNAFLTTTTTTTTQGLAGTSSKLYGRTRIISLRMSENEDDAKSRLRSLGYSEEEIDRSTREPAKEQPKVRVDMVDNIDATTITAVGFGLIAFNFFVLANMGDGGIGGVVATIINSF